MGNDSDNFDRGDGWPAESGRPAGRAAEGPPRKDEGGRMKDEGGDHRLEAGPTSPPHPITPSPPQALRPGPTERRLLEQARAFEVSYGLEPFGLNMHTREELRACRDRWAKQQSSKAEKQQMGSMALRRAVITGELVAYGLGREGRTLWDVSRELGLSMTRAAAALRLALAESRGLLYTPPGEDVMTLRTAEMAVGIRCPFTGLCYGAWVGLDAEAERRGRGGDAEDAEKGGAQ